MDRTVSHEPNQIKIRSGKGTGIEIGVPLAGDTLTNENTAQQIFAPNAWVRIGTDDRITVVIDRSEMGQGVLTSLSMLVAEELDVDLKQLRIEFAPADPSYANSLLGEQMTGGSSSIRGAWEPLRQAGATARQLLLLAAAQLWSVDPTTCRTENGSVVHIPTGRRLSYGALAETAATLPVPESIQLKSPEEFRYIGKPMPALDAPDKIQGSAIYGVDIALPGMLVAMVARSPVFGGKIKSFNAEKTKLIKGVHAVFAIDTGVAVVAENVWAAKKGRDILDVVWDEGAHADLDSMEILRHFEKAANRPGTVTQEEGDVENVLKRAVKLIESDYETPYLAHVPLEPMNCTVQIHSQGCDVWVPTQAQHGAQVTAADILGLNRRDVNVHSTFIGGGFGRRLRQDFVSEAKPIQLIWTLTDDLQHDFYRPANYTRLQAALDGDGKPLAWFQRIVGPDFSLGGVDLPYHIPNIRIECREEDPGIPTGAWRSVGASQNAFAIESFIEEMAHAAGVDPFQFRRLLLSRAPRHKAVLELAADKAGWGKPLPNNHYRGIAVYHSFGSWVAQVAEISISDEDKIRVHRVICAIDCGTVVNPDTVVAQMEGSVVFGLSAALKEEIQIQRGRVLQSNFSEYPILTMAEMPQVEVHILPSKEPPGGVGEPGVPPIAPAVANAVFAATGKRVRRLPIQISKWQKNNHHNNKA